MVASLRNSYETASNTTATQVGVAVEAGDLIIVAWSVETQTYPTCSDNASGGSNVYKEVGNGNYDVTSLRDVHLFYAIAKATETLTITVSGIFSYSTICVHVVSGMLQSLDGILDTYSFSHNTTAVAHTSTFVKTNNANDYIFLWYSQDTATLTTGHTEASGGFTKQKEHLSYTSGGPSASFDKIVSAVGVYKQSITLAPTVPIVSVMAAFKIAMGPTITSFTASPVGITSGSSSTLTWNITNSTSLSIDQGIGTVTGTTRNVSPTVNTTYTISATNTDGTTQASVSVGIIGTAIQLDAFQNDACQVISGGVTYNATTMMIMF